MLSWLTTPVSIPRYSYDSVTEDNEKQMLRLIQQYLHDHGFK